MDINIRMGQTTERLKIRNELYMRWKAADAAVQDTIARSTKSSTMSGGTGSESYTALDLKDLIAERDSLAAQIASHDRNGRPSIRRVRIAFNQ